MFDFFKAKQQQGQNNENKLDEHHKNSDDLSQRNSTQVSTNAKEKHGVDGVCCGGCGGQ